MEKITIYPKEKLVNKLKKEKETQGRSMNNLILFIINKYFDGGER